MIIPFNKPFFTGKETFYIKDTVERGHISGNGFYTKKCQSFFEETYGFSKCLLTTSCTDALEMASILIDIKPGDEVIIPSFTFVSTANAFALRGAKIVFVDSREDHPGINEDLIEGLITEKTKAIVPVHYAGVACDMDKIMHIAKKYNLFVIEDAAQAINSYYTSYNGERRALGSIGHLAAFSFHETKNIISGEGGMLVVNDSQFEERAEIIWEKGTNRSKFFRGEVDKYTWVDIGSSFLPSDINAAFLWAQIENLEFIQNKRLQIWNTYFEALKIWSESKGLKMPTIPNYATNNAHMFYLSAEFPEQRTEILLKLKENNIHSVFHYLSLHKSDYYLLNNNEVNNLNFSDYYSDNLFRLPFYINLEIEKVIEALIKI